MLHLNETFSTFRKACGFRRAAHIMKSGGWCGYGVSQGDEVIRCRAAYKCPRIVQEAKQAKFKTCPLNKRGTYRICKKCPGVKGMEFCKV